MSVSALASPLVLCGHYKGRVFACQQKYCVTALLLQECYTLRRMKIIGTAEAARRLNITQSRVRAMIDAGRLKAIKVGREWLIDPKDLDTVKDRKTGRPRKARKSVKR